MVLGIIVMLDANIWDTITFVAGLFKNLILVVVRKFWYLFFCLASLNKGD